jgi:hypothetical protein
MSTKRSRTLADADHLLNLRSNIAGKLDLNVSEIIKIQVENIRLSIGGDVVGEGILYVTTERIAWLRVSGDVSGSGTGFTVSYPNIAIHAICRDKDSFPEPCIFCQLDEPVKKDGGKAFRIIEGALNNNDNDDNEGVVTGLAEVMTGSATVIKNAADEDDEEDNTSRIDTIWRGSDELRFIPFIPEDKKVSSLHSLVSVSVPGEPLAESLLDKIFNAMSECAMLHPDGNNEDEENENGEYDDDDEQMGLMEAMLSSGGGGSDGIITDEGGLSAEQMAALEAWGSKLKTEQFDDAEEEEEGGNMK